MIKPIAFKEIKDFGWYIYIDIEHQKTKNMHRQPPYGGWFYEWTSDGWRNTEGGCLNCRIFYENDLLIGPIFLS